MATVYILACTSGEEEATLEISDNWNFPGFNDEWRCKEGEAVFGEPAKGKILDWGREPGEETTLSTGIASPHRLAGFKPGIAAGAKGTGYKTTIDGSFPSGDFDWTCMKVS